MITRGEKLIYRDNTCYLPDQMPMEGIGMYEGYTHMANLFLSRLENADMLLDEIREILDGDPEIDGGATTLSGGDLAVRIFGHRAQRLQQTAEKIKAVYEKLLLKKGWKISVFLSVKNRRKNVKIKCDNLLRM